MLDIFSHRELWPLDPDQILILSSSSFKNQPVVSPIALVLVALAKIPPEDEVLRNIIDARSDQTHGDIVPWHATIFRLRELIGFPVLNCLEVHDTVVVEVLARKYFMLHTCRVDVRQGVLVVVPTSEAEVNTADEGNFVVYHNEFFMMSLMRVSLHSF